MLDRFVRHSWACLIPLFFVPLASAQPGPADAAPAIELEEALARTLAENPGLVAFGHQIQAAEGRLQQAHIAPNPELGIAVNDALGTGDLRDLRSAETTVTIAWVLERGVRRRQIDAALTGVELSTAEAGIMQLDAAAETARQFLTCLTYQARLVNAAEGIRLARQTIAAVRGRVEAGRAPQAELSRAEAGLVRAELLEEDYTHQLLSAYHRLSAQWGDTEPDFETVAGDLLTLPAQQSLPMLLSRMEQNPDLARFVSQQRVSEAEMRVAEARSRPDLRAYAGVRRVETSDDFALVGGITVPFGTRDRYRGRIAELRADMARTHGEANATRVRIETSLFVLHQELLHHIQVAATLRDDLVPLLQSALADTRRAYDLGRSSYLDLSAVQSELLEANGERLESSVTAHELVVEIERLTGVSYSPPTSVQ